MEFIAVLAIIGVITVFLSAPFLSGRREPDELADLADLEERKQAKLREIRDAELDVRTGKLSQSDYEKIDATLRKEAVEIIRELDQTRASGRDSKSSS